RSTVGGHVGVLFGGLLLSGAKECRRSADPTSDAIRRGTAPGVCDPGKSAVESDVPLHRVWLRRLRPATPPIRRGDANDQTGDPRGEQGTGGQPRNQVANP